MRELKTTSYFVVGITGAVFYFLLLTTLGLMWRNYNPVLQSMSEIGSVASPYKNIMNYLGFSLLGICITFFGIGLFKKFGKGILQYLTFFLVLVAGIFMFTVGFFPCDAGCVDVTKTGAIHSLVSTVPSIALPLAAMLMATIITKKWGTKWGHISFWLGVISMASGPVMFVPQIAPYLGIVQRIGIGLSLLWMALVSTKAIKDNSINKT